MTPEKHQAEHARLHRALDELLACYLTENSGLNGSRRGSIYDEMVVVLKWAHEKALEPSPDPFEDRTSHALGSAFLIATNDDPELLEWLAAADRDGGGFVKAIAHAGLQADCENYPLIRTLLLVMRRKYPAYEPSDAVKQEIRERRA